jgi:hypothetical protein
MFQSADFLFSPKDLRVRLDILGRGRGDGRQKFAPAKGGEQNRKRRKVFGKAFRAKLRNEQNGDEHQKESGFFRQFAARARRKKYIADKHRN